MNLNYITISLNSPSLVLNTLFYLSLSLHDALPIYNFIIVYLDNIIIYLNSKKEYKEYIKWVLSRLYKENMLVVIKKCKFHTKKTDFIGFIIKLRQISMDLKKIKAIVN